MNLPADNVPGQEVTLKGGPRDEDTVKVPNDLKVLYVPLIENINFPLQGGTVFLKKGEYRRDTYIPFIFNYVGETI